MKKNRFFLSLFFIISYSFSDDNRWAESSFPGGYLSLGIQMGKTKDNSRFIDIQISPTLVLIGPYKHDFPGYLFLGSSIGKRFSIEKSIIYLDVNLNFWNTLLTLGKGKGFLLDKNEKYPRTKNWAGLGFFPLIACIDNYIIDKNKYKQSGIMGVIPFPFFGNNFYP